MNLTRALNVALPDIPARTLSSRIHRLDPSVTFREHFENGEHIIRVYIPSSGYMYMLSPGQWALAQLFDGNRTYADIAKLYSAQTGQYYDEQTIAEFGGDMESAEFWYRTSQEKNVLLLLQNKDERRKNLKAKSIYSDLSEILFPAFNPDRGLTWIYSKTRFFYARWFVILTVIAFFFTFGISVSHWSEIGRDTLQFFNFSNKTASDIVMLYILSIFVVGIHEYSHAHACKHAGGRVPQMGFALIFLAPAFYTDTTEGAVMGNRTQRLVISLAGIWGELMLCAIATPVWWLTEPNTPVHEAAYFLMMLTGLVSLIMNWNPLMKLDGYYMLCDIVGIPDLKEASTAYVSAWVRRHIWRLPVEVPYVPKRRRVPFTIYALLSGAYSYTILTIVARFAGNVSRNFSPEWAFIPEYGVAALIFKSRIILLVNFMKLVYLDKKDRLRAWLLSRRGYLFSTVVILLLLLPVFHQSTTGPFRLEPLRRAVVRTAVPGVLENTFVREGTVVAAGQSLATLRNIPLQSAFAGARAQYAAADSRARTASLQFKDYGAAIQDRERLATQSEQLRLKTAALQLTSPISGVVVTPRLDDRHNSYLTQGTDLLEIADLDTLRARILVSEYDMYKVHLGARARLQVESVARLWDSEAVSVAPVSSEFDPTLVDPSRFKGLHPPRFYLVELQVPSQSGLLKPGMIGVARIYGKRMSLATLAFEDLKIVLGRKIW
jgi:putative peptide zinc metalloprotease protein